MSAFVDVREGTSPLVLGMPHVGTMLLPEITVALNDAGRAVPDTDWWIDRLYGFADEFAPTVVAARLSRYVVDLNRDPSGASLYPGQATTGLCPTTTFDGAPIYRPGAEPDDDAIARRRERWFLPFHAALADAIAKAVDRHGYCVLYDCHSIRSTIPRLFDGRLPTLNLGTNKGASCAPEIAAAALAAAEASGFTHVLNGRFTGGWITRNYGRPGAGVHVLQMELAQADYMLEAEPWTYDTGKAGKLQAALRSVLAAMLEAAAMLPR